MLSELCFVINACTGFCVLHLLEHTKGSKVRSSLLVEVSSQTTGEGRWVSCLGGMGGKDQLHSLRADGLVDVLRRHVVHLNQALEGPVGRACGVLHLVGHTRLGSQPPPCHIDAWCRRVGKFPSGIQLAVPPPAREHVIQGYQRTSPILTARSNWALLISSDRLCRLSSWEKQLET